MSFTNLPGQLIAIFIGWVFTLHVQHRANLRAEAIRKKDKLIDRAEKLVDWMEKAFPIPEADYSMRDEIYAAHIFHIERSVYSLNTLLRDDAINIKLVVEIRKIDITEQCVQKSPVKQLRLAVFDLVEALEASCDKRYFSKKNILQHARHHLSELYGIIIACVALILILVVSTYASWLLLGS